MLGTGRETGPFFNTNPTGLLATGSHLHYFPTMQTIPLSQLARGQRARICGFDGSDAFQRKLLEMGMEEGQEVALMHTGPIGRDPLAIRMHDRTIALRRRDASQIAVEIL